MHWTRKALEIENPNALFFDGLDDAIIGIARRPDQPGYPVYDRDAIIEQLMLQGMDGDDAWEFYSYNIESLYGGEHTPLILERSDMVVTCNCVRTSMDDPHLGAGDTAE